MDDFVGVIGGLGAKATAIYFSQIVERTAAATDQEHINLMLLNHATIPDRTAFIMDETKPSPLPELIQNVHLLTKAGCSFISIPCNTAHHFYRELQEHTTVPIINMVEETVRSISRRYPGMKRVGVLATEGTIHCGIYQYELEKAGFEVVPVTEIVQAGVTQLIYEQVKQGKIAEVGHYYELLKQMTELGCETVILGCTELSVIHEQVETDELQVVDAQLVLVDRTIEMAGKSVKPAYVDRLTNTIV
ncbi:aspartate/glutamate racemase family protein [Shouchella shacheensis]|uniref:aspartate/glutamate racemase family protein n=1 Tax=Shouchella shacheensis TaxID=1649580 RepID=UPI0007402360|nr:amino acid racemase [Shouchella shacheensis]